MAAVKSNIAQAVWIGCAVLGIGYFIFWVCAAIDDRHAAEGKRAAAELARIEQFKADHHCRITGLTWFRQKWTCDHGYTYEEKL